MNGRVNDKVKDLDLEAICSKRHEELHSHGLSPEDLVSKESEMRAVISGPGPIERILPDKLLSPFQCEISKQPTKEHGEQYGEMMDGLVTKWTEKRAVILGGSGRSLNLNPLKMEGAAASASKHPTHELSINKNPLNFDTIDAVKLAQKQKDMMDDLMQAATATAKRVRPFNLSPDELFPARLPDPGHNKTEPKPQPASKEELVNTVEELEKQMKTIAEEYESALASKTAAEAYESALAAKAALVAKHAEEKAETARRQQEAERLVETELTRAAHRLQFEIWVSKRSRNKI